ncbi:MAG: ABC transporter permease [Planctomycetota bacterium]
MQLRHMLGGRRKWLVVVCLVLPVLLSYAAIASGGLGALQRQVEAERSWQTWLEGGEPETAYRVQWEGKDQVWFRGRLVLTENGPEFDGRPAGVGRLTSFNGGHIVLRNGELWIDPAREGHRGLSWRVENPFPPDRAVFRPRGAGFPVDTIAAIFLFLLYPTAVCLLLSLFYGTSVLGEELDGKTLTYLWTRPLPRWQFVVGKYAGIVTALSVPTALSLAAAWAVAGQLGGVTLLLAMTVGTVLALAAYNALFVLFGFLVPRRAMITALLYGLIFELILSFAPALVNEFTITYYLRSIVVAMLDLEIPRELARMVGGASVPGALAALAAIVGVSLTLASLLAARREYVIKDAA